MKRIQNLIINSFNHPLVNRVCVVNGLLVAGWLVSLSLPLAAHALPDFSDTGRSGNRVGGASRRGGCAAPEYPMMPFVPLGADYGGRTVSAQPTFWVYVPYVLDDESPVTFEINDENGNDIYRATFTPAFDAGVYGIQLPESVELEVGTYYDWYFLVYCNDPLRQEVPSFAGGWIQRVDYPSGFEADDVETMTPVDQSRLFADNLLWYDALTPLGQALQANANDPMIRSTWEELLTLPSVQLDEFNQFPVVSCCEMSDTTNE